jgi:hypothetical protein
MLAVIPLVEIALEVLRDVGPDEEKAAHLFSPGLESDTALYMYVRYEDRS